MTKNPDKIPPALEFIRIKEPNGIALIVQLILVEVLIDALKLASLNTPTSLSNALSLVGALVFGEFAVQAGLFVPELLAYMAFVAIASFTQPSHELAYAFKLFRVLFLLLTWVCSFLIDCIPSFKTPSLEMWLAILASLLFSGIMYAVSGWIMERKLSV